MDEVSKNKGHLATAGFILVSLAAGVAIGLSLKGFSSSENKSCEAVQAEWTNKLVEEGYIQPESEMTKLNGVVTEINGDTLTLEVANVNRNPLSDPSPKVRKVTLAAGGKIVKQVALPMDKQEAEWNAYMEAESAYMSATIDPENQPNIEPPVAPLPYVEEAATMADIKVGDYVSVIADTDIRLQEKISAKSIGLQVPAEIPSVIPPVAEDMEVVEPFITEEAADLDMVPAIE